MFYFVRVFNTIACYDLHPLILIFDSLYCNGYLRYFERKRKRRVTFVEGGGTVGCTVEAKGGEDSGCELGDPGTLSFSSSC